MYVLVLGTAHNFSVMGVFDTLDGATQADTELQCQFPEDMGYGTEIVELVVNERMF